MAGSHATNILKNFFKNTKLFFKKILKLFPDVLLKIAQLLQIQFLSISIIKNFRIIYQFIKKMT